MEKISDYSIGDKLSSMSSQVKSDMRHYLEYVLLLIICYSSICNKNNLETTKHIISDLSVIFENWAKRQLDLLDRSHVSISII